MRHQKRTLVLLLLSAVVFAPYSSASPVLVNVQESAPNPGTPLAVEFWVQAVTANTPGTHNPAYGTLILDRSGVRDPAFGDFGVSVTRTGERTVGFSVSTSAGSIALGSFDIPQSVSQQVVIARNQLNGDFGVFINGFLNPNSVIRSAAAGLASNPAYVSGSSQSASLAPATLSLDRATSTLTSSSTASVPMNFNYAYAAQYRGAVFSYETPKFTFSPLAPGALLDAPEPGSFWLMAFGAGLSLLLLRNRARSG